MAPPRKKPARPEPRELEGRITASLPKFTMKELYDPVMVTIRINTPSEEGTADKKTFKIPKEMICRHSQYFRASFEGFFSETKTRALTLHDVRSDVFATFVTFCYVNEVVQKSSEDSDSDPTKWTWPFLFDCYIFSDKYDIKRYRAHIFEAIQIKMLLMRPQTSHFPLGDALTKI